MAGAVAAISSFLVGVGFSAAAASFISTVFVYASSSYLLNRASEALTPKRSTAGLGNGTEINYYDSGASIRIPYGRVRTGGMETIPPLTSGEDSRYLHKVLTLAGCEIDSFNATYFDDKLISNDQIGAMTFTTSDGRVNSGHFATKAWVRRYRGTSTDSADRILMGVDSAAFNNSRARGIAKAALQFQFDDKVYQSVPDVTFTYQGKRCYDPRLDVTPGASPTNASYIAWTQNPALCLADYLMATYGGEYASSEIDWSTVVTAANYCDGSVAGQGATYTASSANIQMVGSTISRTGGADAWTAGAVTSSPGFETVLLTWRAGQTNQNVFIGLTTSGHLSETQDYPRVDFAWFANDTALASIWERGVLVSATAAYTTSTDMSITYDGVNIRYYLGGVLAKTTNAPGLTLHMDAMLLEGTSNSATITNFGPSQSRYTTNGVLFATEDFTENVKALTDAMLGRIMFRDGQWRMFAGSWQTPTFTIQKEDWISGLSIRFEQGRQKRFNRLKCWYVDRSRNYQRVECNPRYNTTYRTADGSEDIEAEVEQLLCDNESEAQRKGEFLLRQSRNQITVVGRLPPRFQNIALWDTGTIVFDHLGWSSKTFRAVGIDMNEDGSMDCVFAEEQSTDWTDLLSSEYNQPSNAPLPEINVTQPSEPSSLGVTEMINGTLMFDIGTPVVKPYGTEFQVIRSTNSANAAVGTVIWQGAANQVSLVTPTSRHWYWVRAVANSAFSAYQPNTYGTIGVPYGMADNTRNAGIISDPDILLSAAPGDFWATSDTNVFSLSPAGGLSGGKVVISNVNTITNILWSIPNSPAIPSASGLFSARIRARITSLTSVPDSACLIGVRLFGWTGVSVPNTANTFQLNGVNYSVSPWVIVRDNGVSAWGSWNSSVTSFIATNTTGLTAHVNPTSYPYLVACLFVNPIIGGGFGVCEVDLLEAWYR